MIDLAIRSERVITSSGIRSSFVLIADGRIIGVENEIPAGVPFSDLGHLVLMAGIVDPHVHINEPGRPEWEGFNTATRAAIAGGITTLVEMPLNASPVTTTVKAFEQKINAASGKIHCHCGFWGGVIPGNEKDIEPLIKSGVLGFKAFLTGSGIDEFPCVTEQDLRLVMPILSRHDVPLLVHCELHSHQSRPSQLNPNSYQNYLASRPKKWEDDAINLVIRLCEEFNCHTHIVHLSAASSIQQIAEAKQRGLRLTVETCPHYLYFCSEEIPDGSPLFKCAPPIRDRENNEQLWEALKNGIIDFVATDHSPAPPSMKSLDTGDLFSAWGGIASLQLSLPVVWTSALKHGCALEDISRWLCEKPARLPHLNTKGTLNIGADADLVAWDPESSFKVTEEMILHRYPFTPYTGETLKGVVRKTWLRGEKVFDDGKFLHLNKGQVLDHD
jgi:allantoinase